MIETRENSSEKKSAKRAAVTVSVPASTANLGPGFDSFALALDLRNRFTFEFMDEPVAEPIILTRAIAGLETDRRNFVFRAFESCWACDPAMLNRLRIEIDARIPIGSGLGSSASCAAAAAIAATALSGAASEPAHLVRLAGAFEGHPDNVCAQIVGGFVVCAEEGKNIFWKRLPWPERWRTLVLVPQYKLSTAEARAILPSSYPRADAISNVQRAALFVSALASADERLMRVALHDRMHEPYRESLVPELAILRKALAQSTAALGCVLSGAGPSVLTIVHERHSKETLAFLRNWAKKQPSPPELLDLRVDQEGARIE